MTSRWLQIASGGQNLTGAAREEAYCDFYRCKKELMADYEALKSGNGS